MKELLIRHQRSIWLCVILVTLAGLVAATRLPVSLFPHIDYPRVVVSIDAGERDPEQMAAQITRPAEIALKSVPGVTQVRSTTSRGSAEVQLSFDWAKTWCPPRWRRRRRSRRSRPICPPVSGSASVGRTRRSFPCWGCR